MPKRKASAKAKAKEEKATAAIAPEASANGEEEEEEKEEAPAKKVKISEKDRPEDCDAYWKDDGGDSTEKEDEQSKDFSWPPRDKDRQVKIVTWNVAGFRAVLKKGFEAYVAQEDPDVLCLQETKVAEKLAASPEFKKILPGYHRYFFECKKSTGQHGTAVFTKAEPVSVTKGLGKKELDEGGRAITVEYEKFYVLCTYVPNSSRDLANWPLRERWDAALLDYLKELDKKKPVIWCGDLNVAHLWIDLANPKPNCNKTAGFLYGERDDFTRVLESGFVDVFRNFHPKAKKAYTFWSYLGGARAKNVGWRLDYFIVSERILSSVSKIWRRASVMGSDHCPLCILLDSN